MDVKEFDRAEFLDCPWGGPVSLNESLKGDKYAWLQSGICDSRIVRKINITDFQNGIKYRG